MLNCLQWKCRFFVKRSKDFKQTVEKREKAGKKLKFLLFTMSIDFDYGSLIPDARYIKLFWFMFITGCRRSCVSLRKSRDCASRCACACISLFICAYNVRRPYMYVYIMHYVVDVKAETRWWMSSDCDQKQSPASTANTVSHFNLAGIFLFSCVFFC